MLLEISLSVYQIAVTLGFSVGFLWGEAFSGFDAQVKYEDDGYEGWSRWKKFLVGAFLDANHHFQYGLAIMLVAMLRPDLTWIYDLAWLDFTWLNVHPTLTLILLWLGWGLVVSDWKDYRHVLGRMNIGQGENNDG